MANYDKASPPRPIEDLRFLTGQARYTDDFRDQDALHAVFLRSPIAHGESTGLDTSAALDMPSVIDVLTAAQLDEDNIGDIPCFYPSVGKDGRETVVPPAPLLAGKKVVYVGEPVALVIAETANAARDAAEAIMASFETLPPVDATASALLPDAP